MSSPTPKIWNCYLLASTMLLRERQQVLNFLDTIPEVVNWRATQLIILVVTNLTKRELAIQLKTKFPSIHVILADVDRQSTQGWVEKATWDFINEPKPLPHRANKLLGPKK